MFAWISPILSLERLKSSELNSVWDADSLTKVHVKQKDGAEEYSLQIALEASKKAVLQGSMDVLLVI